MRIKLGLTSWIAVCAFLMLGCSGGKSPIPSQELDGSSQLPSIDELDALSRETSYTVDPDQYLEASAAFYSSGNAHEEGSDMVIETAPGEMGYCIYQFGVFAEGDAIESLEVTGFIQNSSPANPFDYYVAISNYETGGWQFFSYKYDSEIQELNISHNPAYLSPNGNIYVAIIVHDGIGFQLAGINGHFVLNGRELDHVRVNLPSTAIVDIDLHLNMVVEDSDDWNVFTFNGEGEITSDPEGIEVDSQPEFVEGIAKCTVSFPEAGHYELHVSGLDEDLDGLIGTLDVAEPTDHVPIYEITIDQDELDFMWQNLAEQGEQYAHANLSIDGESEGHVITRFLLGGVGTRPKKSWRIEWPGEYLYFDPLWGYEREKMELIACYTDSSLLREPMTAALMMEAGMLASRVKLVRFYVNGDYWGVFADIEHPREAWLESFGVDSTGPLYKAHRADNAGFEKDKFHPTWYSAYYRRYNKHLQRDKLDGDGNQDWSDLLTLILDINDWEDNEFYEKLNQSMDTEQLIKSMIFHSFSTNAEQVYNNYSVYRDEVGSGKWIFIPYDYDMAWGKMDYLGGELDPTLYHDVPINIGKKSERYETYGIYNILMDRFYEDAHFYAEWESAMRDALDTYLSVDHVHEVIDDLYDLIEPYAKQDHDKWEPAGYTYEQRVEALKQYVSDRHAFILEELDN